MGIVIFPLDERYSGAKVLQPIHSTMQIFVDVLYTLCGNGELYFLMDNGNIDSRLIEVRADNSTVRRFEIKGVMSFPRETPPRKIRVTNFLIEVQELAPQRLRFGIAQTTFGPKSLDEFQKHLLQQIKILYPECDQSGETVSLEEFILTLQQRRGGAEWWNKICERYLSHEKKKGWSQSTFADRLGYSLRHFENKLREYRAQKDGM